MANDKVISTAALIGKFREALNDKWGYIWATAGDKWTAAKQAAIEKTTDSDRAQARKYGSKWIGHYVADCSGLFHWAFAKLGSYMYHGSDTMYRKYCTDHGELKNGKRTDGKPLKPGTAVFCWNGTKYSHVGLFVGDGLVIEAASTQQGVITSKVTASKWDYWGELKNVDYSNQQPDKEPTPAPAIDYPTIKKGSKGESVEKVQTILLKLGYDLGSYGIDGDFGKATEKAVKEFQKDHRLTADGIVGPKTYEALFKADEMISPVRPEPLYDIEILNLTKAQVDELKKKYPNVNVIAG